MKKLTEEQVEKLQMAFGLIGTVIMVAFCSYIASYLPTPVAIIGYILSGILGVVGGILFILWVFWGD